MNGINVMAKINGSKKGSNRIYNCLTSAKKVAYKFIAK